VLSEVRILSSLELSLISSGPAPRSHIQISGLIYVRRSVIHPNATMEFIWILFSFSGCSVLSLFLLFYSAPALTSQALIWTTPSPSESTFMECQDECQTVKTIYESATYIWGLHVSIKCVRWSPIYFYINLLLLVLIKNRAIFLFSILLWYASKDCLL
jgi:hypothetical protein